jgi:3-oxosteroid 1-dehydrogenase
MTQTQEWTEEHDVVVLGSGGAALTTAILAHDHGADTAVFEKAPVVGGTTAMSGGMLWVPNTHHAVEAGIDDSYDDALTYMTSYAGETVDETMLRAFLDSGPEMIKYLEDHTELRFVCSRFFPDYHPEIPGGREGGRSVEPLPYSFDRLGEWADRVNVPAASTVPSTFDELTRAGGTLDPDVLEERLAANMRASGNGLIAALLRGCLDREIPIHTDSRGVELVLEDGQVIGVVIDHDGERKRVRARRGVVLGTGGFEWNADLVRSFLRGPMTHPRSAPENEGDGLVMAMAAGASLGLMSEAWWMPTIEIPGDELRGKPVSRLAAGGERAYPHSIMVNAEGHRFVNEACNYNTMMRSFHEYKSDSRTFGFRNLPCWLIHDQAYHERFPLLEMGTGGEGGAGAHLLDSDGPPPLPSWVTTADTLPELAEKLGIPADALVETVERFNRHAENGVDPDFHRGESRYDNYMGDQSLEAPFSTLGPLSRGPFYAAELKPGAIGTKGGPRTTVDAQVLHMNGEPITGLYAVGNTMANPQGAAYFGAGNTIGFNMTFAYRAGKSVAAAPAR